MLIPPSPPSASPIGLADIYGIDIEAEYASDTWAATRLGMTRKRQPYQISFEQVTQPWLRTAVKRWLRLRLGSGITFGTVAVDLRSMIWFSRFLNERLPGSVDEQQPHADTSRTTSPGSSPRIWLPTPRALTSSVCAPSSKLVDVT